MPSRICNRCLTKLKIANGFRTTCINSDKQLRDFIGAVKHQWIQQTIQEPETYEDEELLLNDSESGDKCETRHFNDIHHQSNVQLINIVHDEEHSGEQADENTKGQQVFLLKIQNESQSQEHSDSRNDSENTNTNEGFVEFQEHQAETQSKIENSTISTHEYSDEVYEKSENHNLAGPKLKGFHCDKCDKYFSTKTNLYRHINTHDGTKPYTCSLCKSSFTQNGSLKQHMLIHTGDRPFVCNVSKNRFYFNENKLN